MNYWQAVRTQVSKAVAVAALVSVAFVAVPMAMAGVERITTHQCSHYGVTQPCDNAPDPHAQSEQIQDDPNPAPTELACVHGQPVGGQDACSYMHKGHIWITNGAHAWQWHPVTVK